MPKRTLQKHRVYIAEAGIERGGKITLISTIFDVGELMRHKIHTQSVIKEVFAHFVTSIGCYFR